MTTKVGGAFRGVERGGRDEDWLVEHCALWVEAGILTDGQAQEIRQLETPEREQATAPLLGVTAEVLVHASSGGGGSPTRATACPRAPQQRKDHDLMNKLITAAALAVAAVDQISHQETESEHELPGRGHARHYPAPAGVPQNPRPACRRRSH